MLDFSNHPDIYLALLQTERAMEDFDSVLDSLDETTRTRLHHVDKELLRAIWRAGLTNSAIPQAHAICEWIKQQSTSSLVQPNISLTNAQVLHCSEMSQARHPAFNDPLFDQWFAAQPFKYGIGRYGEQRAIYVSEQYADPASTERRTMHLGIDIFAKAGTPLFAPLPGKVKYITYNGDYNDYGYTLILEHNAQGIPFYTLYGHLSKDVMTLHAQSSHVAKGQLIAHIGDWPDNGHWAPHVHVQLITDLLSQHRGNFFGVGHAHIWPVWNAICPDPNLFLRLPFFDY